MMTAASIRLRKHTGQRIGSLGWHCWLHSLLNDRFKP